VRGFTLGIGRTVLAGGVGKMVGLARSNLRNIPRPLPAASAGVLSPDSPRSLPPR
jgi:hypothetical protein